MKRKILIIGAGAIGQVYGAHLAAGGADVGVYVRAKHVRAACEGYALHRLRRMRAPQTLTFHPSHVVTSLDAVRNEPWDILMLAVPSDRLDDELLEAVAPRGKLRRIVTLQPGFHGISKLTQHVPREKMITGTVGFIAYHAPLPGEALPKGVAFYLPPLVKSVFSGEGSEEIVELLNRGGLPAKLSEDARHMMVTSTAVLTPHIAALEAANWSFKKLRSSDLLQLANRGTQEALRACEALDGVDTSIPRRILRPALVRVALRGGSMVFPFNLEAYLAAHYTKVRSQSLQLLSEYIELAHSNNEGRALEELRGRIRSLPIELS